MKAVKLKDIAQILGVSVTTVSKALKDYPDISPETKQHVKILAEKLNYKPSALAVNFRNKETKIIGLIMPEIVHHFFSNVINGVIAEAEKNGYLVITLQSNESYELEKKQIELLLDQRVDGIIASLSNETSTFEHLHKVKHRDIPLVLVDKTSDEVDCSKVLINDERAAFMAVNHLIQTGCRKIMHINGPQIPKNASERFNGYKKALRAHDITFVPELVYTSKNFSYEEGIAFTEKALSKHPDIDGIFTITDLLAAGCMFALKKHNRTIPDDVSVMGFSNWQLSKLVSPTLSTVEQPNFEMGRRAVSLLLHEIRSHKTGETVKQQHLQLPTHIIERQSTRTVSKT